MFAPTERARRILIAVLAFALAAAFAIAASIAPADAKDPKHYDVDVMPDSVNVSTPADYTVVFANLGPTSTQKVGSFFIDFGFAGFAVISSKADIELSLNASGHDWEVASTSGGKIVLSALSGGDRIDVDDTVTVVVNATAPTPGLKTLETGADQADHGNFKGGNAFTLIGGKETVDVVAVATPCGNQCQLGVEDEWSADLGCTEDCSFLVNPTPAGGDIAEFNVTFDDETGAIVVVMTTDGKGPSPGSAEVEADGKILPDCGISGLETNCVHINRVDGNHTQYTVFWDGDPRFKFR